MSTPTPDAQARIDAFKKECLELVEKYNCDFFAYPQYVPTKDGGFTTRIFMEIMDREPLGAKSPLSVADILHDS